MSRRGPSICHKQDPGKRETPKAKEKKASILLLWRKYKTKLLSCYGKTLYFRGRQVTQIRNSFFWQKKRNNTTYFGSWSV